MNKDEAQEIVLTEGIDSKQVRGKIFWKMICIVVLNYKDTQRDATVSFFSSLQHIIPCPECAQHYKIKLALLFPFFGTNKENLKKFVVNIYNTIELFSGRDPMWTRNTILGKYLGEEIEAQSEIYMNT